MICPNPNCKRIVGAFDEKCQHCGTALKSNPMRDYEKKADEIVKEAGASAEEVLENMRGSKKDNNYLRDLTRGPHIDTQQKVKGMSEMNVQNPTEKPRLFILSIGVSKFLSDEVNPLNLADQDAKDFVGIFGQQEGKLYTSVRSQILLNEHATRDKILVKLKELREIIRYEIVENQVPENELIAMIFLSGHGGLDPLTSIFIPSDYEHNRPDTWLSVRDIRDTLEIMRVKTLLFMDCCFAGNVMNKSGHSANADISSAIKKIAEAGDKGTAVFASSTWKQTSQEHLKWGNGAFTKALKEGITDGRAISNYTNERVVTIKSLMSYIAKRVKELNPNQTPMIECSDAMGKLPVAILDAQV